MTADVVRRLDELALDVLRPGDPGYDGTRAVENGLIDKRPAAIVRCRSEADVVAAVDLARDGELEISIKCSGHHVAGLAVSDGGVMLDMGGLNLIEIDAEARVVRAGAGLTWGELIAATQQQGLVTAGGAAASVGIAGLTLGGGLGWLMAKYGLAVDNLVAARVVTADGRLLTASADEHPDLFWALRGGGGNFGVVTEFSYRLHPLGPSVIAGMISYSIEDAADALRFFRDHAATLSDDLVVIAALGHMPDGSRIVAFAVVHIGSEEEAERELEPLLTYGSPLIVQVGPIAYTSWLEQNNDFTPAKGFQNYLRSNFLRDLSDQAIDTLVLGIAACPSPLSIIAIEHFHGAATRVPVEQTAVAYRKSGYNFNIFAAWEDRADNQANIAWVRNTYEQLRPFFDDRLWVNYAGIDDIAEDDAAARAYGPNYDRLVEVKTAYDPENLFRLNLNVAPRNLLRT